MYMTFKPKILIIILAIGLIILSPQLNVSSANGEISYSKMLKTFENNNTDLREIQLSLNDALRSYQQSQKDVKDASSSWSNTVDMLNKLAIEITNEMKFGTVMQRSVALTKAEVLYKQQQLSTETQKSSLYIELRNSYLNYWQSRVRADLLQNTASISEANYAKNELLYKQHKISLQDLEKAKLNLVQNQNNLNDAKRKQEQSEQALALLIGTDFAKIYEINIWESEEKLEHNFVEPYIKQALKNRLDIVLLQDQIATNKLTIDTYDKYLNYSDLSETQQKSYDQLNKDNDRLYYELQKKKIQVEKEIRNAYLDLQYSNFRIQTLINNRNDLNSDYLKLKEQFKQGKATENQVLEAQLNYNDAHITYLKAIYDYNTQVYKFNCISNAGLNINIAQTAQISTSQGRGH